GYGFARRSRDAREAFTMMITDYLQRTRMLKLALVVIDARTGPTDLDDAMLRFLEEAKIPHLLVANKTDKLSKNDLRALEAGLRGRHPGIAIFYTSTAGAAGRGPLLEAIEKSL
ncbi:MAG TPA: hypothetical protein VLC10_00680, partial [Patescibacteria group bacterium]|nr:hypothetical protein [Patescibacteria group bacterium]